MKESDIQRKIMIALTRLGRVFRNNVGMVKVDDRVVKYGLCKGSSDLIGWTDVDGVAVFTAVEVKTPKGRPTKEQENFIEAVRKSGGIAGIARSDSEAVELIETESERIRNIMKTWRG